MIDEFELYLPWPPTINDYYGHRAAKKRIIPYIKATGKRYRELVEEAIVQQVGYPRIDWEMFVEVTLYPPDARRRDLDNYMKALLDACTQAKLWDDDSLINQLHLYRGQVARGGSIYMEINPAGPVMPLASGS